MITMNPIAAFLAELDQEAQATRRVLDRVPGDKLSWKPNPKSMSLGELALHVASIPGLLSEFLNVDNFELPEISPPAPKSKADILQAFDDGLAKARAILPTFGGERGNQTWRLFKQGRELMAAPRLAMVRPFLFSHFIHHRGQLTVYLRLLDVAVPSVYGPSADENPFAAVAAATH